MWAAHTSGGFSRGPGALLARSSALHPCILIGCTHDMQHTYDRLAHILTRTRTRTHTHTHTHTHNTHTHTLQTDPEAATSWFKKAAEQGCPYSFHNLSIMYAAADNIPQALVYALRGVLVTLKPGNTTVTPPQHHCNTTVTPL
jgi:hypothetical protein